MVLPLCNMIPLFCHMVHLWCNMVPPWYRRSLWWPWQSGWHQLSSLWQPELGDPWRGILWGQEWVTVDVISMHPTSSCIDSSGRLLCCTHIARKLYFMGHVVLQNYLCGLWQTAESDTNWYVCCIMWVQAPWFVLQHFMYSSMMPPLYCSYACLTAECSGDLSDRDENLCASCTNTYWESEAGQCMCMSRRLMFCHDIGFFHLVV